MTSFDLDLIGQDSESLAQNITLEIKGKKSTGFINSTTKRDIDTYLQWAGKDYPNPTINIAAENIGSDTFSNLGISLSSVEGLQRRLQKKLYNPKKIINIVYPRIPKTYKLKNFRYVNNKITDLQASTIVGIELDAGTDIVVPPIPGGVSTRNIVKKVIGRTINEMQTFNDWRPMMGYVPRVDDPLLASDIIKEYLKQNPECRIFGVDFSGSSYPSALLRAVIRSIRNGLKIKGRSEKNENYFLHAFNVSTSRKSIKGVTSITDPLVHTYGINATAGVIWGGGSGPLVPEKCRYMLKEDYGAYRKKEITKINPKCNCPICKKYSLSELYTHKRVLPGLKVHKMHTFHSENKKLSELVAGTDDTKSFVSYLKTKKHATNEMARIMRDVKEILVS